MMQTARVTPDPDALDLGQLLLDETTVQQTILEETIRSAEAGRLTESGRTACNQATDIRGPIRRFPSSVQLSSCPVGMVGIWHTHPTQRGLISPEHSLPDWSNLVFHDVDASMVAGTQESELIVTATDRDVMQSVFQNALGIEAQSTQDVVQAVQSGRIPSPTDARRRVREELAPLVTHTPTSHPSLEARVMDLAIPAMDTIDACGCQCAHDLVSQRHLEADDGRRSLGLHRRAKACQPMVRQTTSGVNVRELAVATVIGNVVGTMTNIVIFGRSP